MTELEQLAFEMIQYENNCPARIQHFIKVHGFSRLIGVAEGLDAQTLFILETAAYVHDIGIKPAIEKYGYQNGQLQEEIGPALAESLLKKLGFASGVIERVCFLVGHHHTYTNIDGIDYQILVEADFLVNLFEKNLSEAAVRSAYEHIFKTESGRSICRTMFSINHSV